VSEIEAADEEAGNADDEEVVVRQKSAGVPANRKTAQATTIRRVSARPWKSLSPEARATSSPTRIIAATNQISQSSLTVGGSTGSVPGSDARADSESASRSASRSPFGLRAESIIGISPSIRG